MEGNGEAQDKYWRKNSQVSTKFGYKKGGIDESQRVTEEISVVLKMITKLFTSRIF